MDEEVVTNTSPVVEPAADPADPAIMIDAHGLSKY